MKVKILVALAVGIVAGVLATWVFVGRSMARTSGHAFAQQYLVAVMDQANVALKIRAQKQMELVATIEASLPEAVLTINEIFRDRPDSTNALWMIKAYYERNSIVVPSEIKDILAALPSKPPPSCQLRLRELDANARTNTLISKTHP